ncbi:hypothetical protein JOC77_001584 [Peribacillus deserti]|uniref:Uncharacterized protein n=1 Tax=Peribacillus deserti TaxID=673318 RepID=A0ABS2QGE1_9BACI|nr:hypothetical protein [Peribacillus deserti]MBM7692157.1 hypothetical protein [Peribacillus deserti]
MNDQQSQDLIVQLTRIADALERIYPPPQPREGNMRDLLHSLNPNQSELKKDQNSK